MPTEKLAITTPDAPAAIGPYTQAVRSGDLLFLSGQVGFDPVTREVVEGGLQAQTRQVLANVEAVLRAAGLSFAPEGVVPPARSTVEVARLPKDALVEIEVLARFPAGA